MEYNNTYKKYYAIEDVMKSVNCYKCDKSSPHDGVYIYMCIKVLTMFSRLISVLVSLEMDVVSGHCKYVSVATVTKHKHSLSEQIK